MKHRDVMVETPVRWLAAVAVIVLGLLMTVIGWGAATDANKVKSRYDTCAAVAETIDGFRRCAGEGSR